MSTLGGVIASSRAFAKPVNIMTTIPVDKATLRPNNVPIVFTKSFTTSTIGKNIL
ncbi:MAG: hypothetical protein ACRCYY_21420 [Trueperaceae bacterium]